MALSLITFTLLWVVSCTILYNLALKKLKEANRIYDDAKAKQQEAIEANERAIRRLDQIQRSLHCMN